MLQKKEKWSTSKPNIKPGQIVLLKDTAAPRSWPMAIVEVFPDKSDVFRTVAVRTSARQFIRVIRSLVPLPISDDDEPEGSSWGEGRNVLNEY